ncbi:hypothetical protein V1478_008436 [Vespula squamosa]|uniref:Uncharacterized protein n=1 Tax=Vespula squamosa TaxID=30214 RepID=A0ABD2ATI0_VESSQ
MPCYDGTEDDDNSPADCDACAIFGSDNNRRWCMDSGRHCKSALHNTDSDSRIRSFEEKGHPGRSQDSIFEKEPSFVGLAMDPVLRKEDGNVEERRTTSNARERNSQNTYNAITSLSVDVYNNVGTNMASSAKEITLKKLPVLSIPSPSNTSSWALVKVVLSRRCLRWFIPEI